MNAFEVVDQQHRVRIMKDRLGFGRRRRRLQRVPVHHGHRPSCRRGLGSEPPQQGRLPDAPGTVHVQNTAAAAVQRRVENRELFLPPHERTLLRGLQAPSQQSGLVIIPR
nr:hypothetical protein [Nonomuraea diastatica]